jgi:hypothetical protein
VSPDISRFISAPDPEELNEVPDVDETPYVLHVPIKPPPPARFANRRKLYDDTAAETVPDFGEGVVDEIAAESTSIDDFPEETMREASGENSDDAAEKKEGGGGRSGRRRRGRGGEPDADRSPGSQRPPRGSNAAQQPSRRDNRPARGERPKAGQQGLTRPAGPENRHSNVKPDGYERPDSLSGETTAGDVSATQPPSSESSSPEQSEGRRRSRRRGRRRGPRPEGGGST